MKKFLEDELNMDSSEFINEFTRFETLLLEWNKKVNLISRKSGSIEEHILNSVFFLSKYKFENKKSAIDIGTGGGFPGIPLKILYPDTDFLLVDSIRKKTAALDDIVKKAGYKKCTVICRRAEEISSATGFKNKYDVVISKAVAPLDKLFLWGKDFLNGNGELLSIKGGNIDEELASLYKLKYKFDVKVINFAFDISYGIEDKKLVILKNIS